MKLDYNKDIYICIIDVPEKSQYPDLQFPKVQHFYTLREEVVRNGTIGLLFNEIINPVSVGCDGEIELSFSPTLFRKVSSKALQEGRDLIRILIPRILEENQIAKNKP